MRKIDLTEVDPYLAAAISTVEMTNGAATDSTSPLPDPSATPSGELDHVLGLAVPPILVGAVGSPIVVLEALVAAMTSSSQSLIVPGIVVLAGGAAGRRRRRRNADLALIGDRRPG